MTITTTHTFCRICEASCGLEATIENGKVSKLSPNKDHIGTLGFSCMKGLHQHKMYDSPDRLKQPLKRVGDHFEPISWSQALAEIGQKVRQLRKQSEQSVGMYVGTAAGFSMLHPIFAEGFMQGIGSHNIYSSSTQDCANRFASAKEMYGFPFFQPFVDLDHVECMLIIGTNPVVSKWTFLQVAHPVKRLKEITKRGAKIIVVDPRYTETAKLATDYHAIRPNADVFFFLSFLHEVFKQGAVKRDYVNQYMNGLDQLESLVEAWPAERTAEVTGISVEQLQAMVASFTQANGAAIVTGTGIGMGKQGTLAHWLAEAINAVTGNLDQQGGTLVGRGIFDFAEFADKNELFNRQHRSRVGRFRELNGGFPGGILADEILTPGEQQIKAMFVTGGNPLLTMANSQRLKDAFQQLELLVVTDIYLNETASLAHYVLPAVSPLQRPDLPFIFPLVLGMQSKPYMAATEALVEPEAEQRDEASIYLDLASACGISLFDSKIAQWSLRLLATVNRISGKLKGDAWRGLPQRFMLDMMLRSAKQGSFNTWLKQPDGGQRQGAKANDFLPTQRPTTKDRKVHLAPASFITEAENLANVLEQELQLLHAGSFRLITKRSHSTHNSWTQNIDELTNGANNQTNFLYLNPLDAEALGLQEGDAADIQSATATIRLPVKTLAELSQKTVSVPHGWGHQGAKGLSVASNIAGANVNILASDGPDNIESLSGMAHLTGIPVSISKASGPISTRSWSGID
ncbi:MAG: molybdopterin-dependent oxidoreductase [Pseudomonadales bacterium]|nr:molybdopterin-dependent oxidoreductase [Pseudomonadales bacterium]